LVLLVLDRRLKAVPSPKELLEWSQEDQVLDLRMEVVETSKDAEKDLSGIRIADFDRVNRRLALCLACNDAAAEDKWVSLILLLGVFVQIDIGRHLVNPIDAALALARALPEVLDKADPVLGLDGFIFEADGIGHSLDD
jgi:hypothetical protein